ncbi:CHAT domain-containing protein [Streptomyces sp. NPDC094034]|uniref:CHAT domain-containing protein n=1 Tax=Streptomyces sp. NPDC094034 TaxID=3155309 RepID=UPI00332A2940
MNDEESGGVQGLRAWVMDATERARRLIPASGGTVAPSGAYDSSVAELTQLASLLDHDPPLRGAVTVWLGAVLATRYVAADGAPEDRERARRLLRDARDRGTAVGAGTDEEARRWAALFLLMLVMPIREMGGAFGQPLDQSAAVDWLVRHKGEGMADATAEMRALLAETAGLPVPPDLLRPFRMLDSMLSALSGKRLGPGDLEQFADMMPPDFPHTNQLRMMAAMMSGMPGSTTGTGRSDPPRREEPRPEPRPGREPEPIADPIPASGDAEIDTDANADAIALEAVFPIIFGLWDALRSGDPETYNQYLGRLRTAHGKLPPGHEMAALLEAQIGLLLQMSEGVGGNLQDQSAADAYKKTVADNFHQVAARSTHPMAAEFSYMARAFLLLDQASKANKAKDADAVGSAVAELAALEEAVPRGSASRFLVQLVHADALTDLGRLTNDKDMMLRGVAYQEKALADSPAFVQEQLASISTDIAATRAALSGDPDLIQVPVPSDPSPHTSVNDLYSSVLSLFTRYDLTDDPADLDAAIATLERIRERVRQGQAPQGAASLVWQLAGTYWIRWSVSGDAGDHTAATATAMESLVTLAADVVLQLGPEHGLLAARSGASRGVQTALWAGSHNRVEEALAALELGRALVLQTASTSRAVPELLQARGHHELAEAWRASGASGASAAADASDAETLGGLPGELPSTLRRKALEALGYRERGSLFTTPTLQELSDGLAESGADALVYLLPGEGPAPGMGIIVGADIGVGVGGLPLLSGAASGPLERYLDAAGARSDNAHDPVAEQAWEQALSELCDWAYQAISPVFEVITEHLAAEGSRRADPSGPPRIVLVPCGRLGIVPWHAARFPAGAPHDYACQAMVITYAASGGQFLRTVKRARRDPAAAPVLVADPRMDLTHAEREVTALRETFYPRARVYGEFFEPSVVPEAAGTPDELVALLADAPSLLHVASHGSAGVRPTLSALHLAFPGRTDELPAEEGGPGAEPDLGMLTVTRLLDRPIGEQDATHGPLVVLSACQTDLSTRDHDEALTLTTAFVSAGARDVVGSRWTTRDGASVLLMAVFHHYVAVEGRSPVDALRAAQLWMLDPHRTNPGSLSGDLLRELGRPGLDRLSVWAPFIHQGHPGPADPRERTA